MPRLCAPGGPAGLKSTIIVTGSGLEDRHGRRQGTQEFIRILELHRTYPADLIRQALEPALAYHSYSLDAVQNLLHQLTAPRATPGPLDLSAAPEPAITPGAQPDLSHFNRLLEGMSGE